MKVEYGVVTRQEFMKWVRENKKWPEGAEMPLEEVAVLYAEMVEEVDRKRLRAQLLEAQGGG